MPLGSHAKASRFVRPSIGPRALVAPLVLGLLVFAIYPLIYLVILSASKSLLGKTFQEWVGLANYRNALRDAVFTDALLRSVRYALPISAIELLAGLFIALLLQHARRGGHVIRTLILLPLMTPPIMVATAWKLMYHPSGGWLNGTLLSLGITDRPISFLGSSRWAFPAIGVADFWQWTPFVILLAYAGLQALPPEIQEAALVDGASGWRASCTRGHLFAAGYPGVQSLRPRLFADVRRARLRHEHWHLSDLPDRVSAI